MAAAVAAALMAARLQPLTQAIPAQRGAQVQVVPPAVSAAHPRPRRMAVQVPLAQAAAGRLATVARLPAVTAVRAALAPTWLTVLRVPAVAAVVAVRVLALIRAVQAAHMVVVVAAVDITPALVGQAGQARKALSLSAIRRLLRAPWRQRSSQTLRPLRAISPSALR